MTFLGDTFDCITGQNFQRMIKRRFAGLPPHALLFLLGQILSLAREVAGTDFCTAGPIRHNLTQLQYTVGIAFEQMTAANGASSLQTLAFLNETLSTLFDPPVTLRGTQLNYNNVLDKVHLALVARMLFPYADWLLHQPVRDICAYKTHFLTHVMQAANGGIDFFYAEPWAFACLEKEFGASAIATIQRTDMNMHFGGVIFVRNGACPSTCTVCIAMIVPCSLRAILLVCRQYSYQHRARHQGQGRGCEPEHVRFLSMPNISVKMRS